MRNPKDGYIGYGSAFASPYIGSYEIHSVRDKGTYRLATISPDGKRSGLLRNPTNWSRLCRYVPVRRRRVFCQKECGNINSATPFTMRWTLIFIGFMLFVWKFC